MWATILKIAVRLALWAASHQSEIKNSWDTVHQLVDDIKAEAKKK